MDKAAQLELFVPGKSGSEARPERRPFWSCVRGYERAIIVIISAIIIGVVSYSLGVEKGKRIELIRASSRLDMAAAKPVDAPAATQPEPAAVPDPGTTKANEPGLQPGMSSYTIQVASLRNEPAARKEAEALRKKGLSVVVLSKGKYNVICVGHFPDKAKAGVYLSQLRKTYKDCFIRRL